MIPRELQEGIPWKKTKDRDFALDPHLHPHGYEAEGAPLLDHTLRFWCIISEMSDLQEGSSLARRGCLTSVVLALGLSWRIKSMRDVVSLNTLFSAVLVMLPVFLSKCTSFWVDLFSFLQYNKTIRIAYREHILQHMVFYYLGGQAKRTTMIVVNFPDIYEKLIQAASRFGSIPDEISIMLISLEEGRVVNEYLIPLSNGQTTKRLIDITVSDEKTLSAEENK